MSNLMLYPLHSHFVSSQSLLNSLPLLMIDAYFFANGLVSTSAIISSVGQYSKHISWFSSFSLMKWSCTSICLVQEWCLEFFASAMHPWLSHMMDVGLSCTYPTSTKSNLSQTTPLVQWLIVIYSASVVDNAMVSCFLHIHKMTPTPTKKYIAHGELLVVCISCPIYIAKPLKTISFLPRHNLKYEVPFKYFIMCFIAIQCGGPACDMNWLTIHTQMQFWPSWQPLHTWEIILRLCMEHLLFSFAHL